MPRTCLSTCTAWAGAAGVASWLEPHAPASSGQRRWRVLPAHGPWPAMLPIVPVCWSALELRPTTTCRPIAGLPGPAGTLAGAATHPEAVDVLVHQSPGGCPHAHGCDIIVLHWRGVGLKRGEWSESGPQALGCPACVLLHTATPPASLVLMIEPDSTELVLPGRKRSRVAKPLSHPSIIHSSQSPAPGR